MRILSFLSLSFLLILIFAGAAEAKIGLNVSLIYKKGIGKGFFLSTEQHSIQSVDEKEHILIQMKNRISADISAFYVQSIHDYGPSGFVRVKSILYNIDGKVAKTNTDKLDIYLGQSKSIVHEENSGEQIELIITPVSL